MTTSWRQTTCKKRWLVWLSAASGNLESKRSPPGVVQALEQLAASAEAGDLQLEGVLWLLVPCPDQLALGNLCHCFWGYDVPVM